MVWMLTKSNIYFELQTLVDSSTEQQSIIFSRRYFWSDLRTIICWLNSESLNYKEYESCGIDEILEVRNLEEMEEFRQGDALSCSFFNILLKMILRAAETDTKNIIINKSTQILGYFVVERTTGSQQLKEEAKSRGLRVKAEYCSQADVF
uniref:Uncharacterized protein n=1 Tax=Megaselia scalaris TaxID=36166 RepID=T1GD63_MEGSC